MLDLDKLNTQFESLKGLDAGQLSKAVKDHQNSLFKLLLVIGTIVLGVMMFNDYRAKDQDVHSRIKLLQAKLDVIKARDAAIQDLNNFKSSQRKKISEFDLITLISAYAKSENVTISSLSPAESQDMGLYDLININFTATSDDFKGLMLFIRKIEKSEYLLRINSWTGHEDGDGNINFTIQISAVQIHP